MLVTIEKLAPLLTLKSTTVRMEGVVDDLNPEEVLNMSKLSDDDKKEVLTLTGSQPSKVMVFSTPAAYEQYVYDCLKREESMGGLEKFAQDCGTLWQYGMQAPASINAYHSGINRPHNTLGPFVGNYNEGSMRTWNTDATNHPNISGAKVGMRDMGDIRPFSSLNHDFFDMMGNPNLFQDTAIELKKKIMISDLANQAKGLVLLYA